MIGIQNIQRTQTTQSKDTIKEWARELNREFSTEEIKTYKKYLKKCSSSLALRLMQIKRILRLHLSPVRMAKVKTTDNKYRRGCRKRETPSLLVGKKMGTATLEISMETRILRKKNHEK